MEGGRQVRHRDSLHGECQAGEVCVGGNVHVAVLPGEGSPGGHGSRDAPGGGGEGNQVARLKSIRREAHRGQGEGRGPPVARQVVASAEAEAHAAVGARGGGGEGGSRAVEGHRSAKRQGRKQGRWRAMAEGPAGDRGAPALAARIDDDIGAQPLEAQHMAADRGPRLVDDDGEYGGKVRPHGAVQADGERAVRRRGMESGAGDADGRQDRAPGAAARGHGLPQGAEGARVRRRDVHVETADLDAFDPPPGKTGQGVGDGDGGDAQVRSQADVFDARPLEADAGDGELRVRQTARGELALDDHPDKRRPRDDRGSAQAGGDEHRHARGPRQAPPERTPRRVWCVRVRGHGQSLARNSPRGNRPHRLKT